jgi:hypothetical protein
MQNYDIFLNENAFFILIDMGLEKLKKSFK